MDSKISAIGLYIINRIKTLSFGTNQKKKIIIIFSLILIVSVVLFFVADVDGDGLNNLSEIQHGTEMFNSDSDFDDLSDGDEINIYGTDPLNDDCDYDGISDGDEKNTYGTDPLDDDTDDDGLDDYVEIFTYYTNPLSSDSDSDGLDDKDEIETYGTNPLDEDYDNDGLNDGDEVELGTDLFNSDTDNDGVEDGTDSNPTIHNWKLMDTDNDGLTDYEEYYETYTDRFNSDTDGDGAPDGYDAHPLETSRKITRNYEWEYPEGSIWTWTIDVSYDLYEYESKLNRISSWNHWSEYTLDPTAKQLANELEEVANEKGFNYYQTVNFIFSFVQSLPYTSDDVTTGADEYPRYPLETLVDGGGDCEDTSILFSSILREMNYDNCLVVFTSPVGHMMVGVWGHSDFHGAYSLKDGKNYYFCETTGTGRKMGYLNSKFSSSQAILYNVGVGNPITPPPPNEPPTASASANPTSGNAPLTAYFTGSGIDTDGIIISYHWDFGDGNTSNLQNPSHTFTNEGIYIVTLTVGDNQGATGVSTLTIDVYARTSFTLNPIDDSYIDSEYPDKNYNEDLKELPAYFYEFSNDYLISYLMFDLSEVSTGSTIKNAELKLYARFLYKPTVVDIYKCYDNSWDESSITWNNAPSYSSTPEASQSINAEGQWYSWDVKNYVQDVLSASKITFVLKTQVDFGCVVFYSKEGWRNPPQLEIELI